MRLALTLLLALAPGGARQDAPLAGFDPRELHLRAVYAERTQAFLDAWERADEAGRERAREALARLRRSGAPAASGPSFPALAGARHALEGEAQTGAIEPLQELADALDLTPVPGFFGARNDGLGELVVVGVKRLWRVQPDGDVQVSLWWLPPESEPDLEPVRARSEPATPAAFEGEGFQMYIRPPVSAPGTWRLEVRLERAGHTARGVPVRVECVADAPAAIGLAREVLEGGGPSRELALGLMACAQRGARLPYGLLPSRTLELLRDRASTRPESRPRPLAPLTADEGGSSVWGWMPVEPARVALVLVAPGHEPPQAALVGALATRWRATAKELSALLLAVDLPRSGRGDDEPGACLDRVHALVGDLVGDLPVVLVARGDSLDLVQRGLASTSAPFAALIAVTPREGPPAAAPRGLPTLMVSGGGPAELASYDEAAWWIGGEREVLLDDPLLPELARSWLPQRLPRPRERDDGR